MGLTVHYTITMADQGAPRRPIDAAVARWRQLAMDLPFDAVGDVRRRSARAIDADRDVGYDLGGHEYVRLPPDGGQHVRIHATYGTVFSVEVAPGCEVLDIGMCSGWARTCRTADGRSHKVTRPRVAFHGFCKTQYAGDPRVGGTANFLRAHLAVIALLEAIGREPGVKVVIQDEGRYSTARYSDDHRQANAEGRAPTYVWHPATRDTSVLLRQLGDYDKLVAALVVSLDKVAPGSESPMHGRPDLRALADAGAATVPPALVKLISRLAGTPAPATPGPEVPA